MSLLSRLETVKPFALTMPMVVAANIPDEALKRITDLIVAGNKELKKRVWDFVNWVRHPLSQYVSAEEAQRRFALLKLRFNDLLDELSAAAVDGEVIVASHPLLTVVAAVLLGIAIGRTWSAVR